MKRRLIVLIAGVLVATLVILAGMRLYPSSRPHTGFASADGDLTCTVKASCDVGEVAVLRMSGLANAHAGTAAGWAYANVVCSRGVAGLSTSCSGTYATALRL
jgi:hypothetical protein